MNEKSVNKKGKGSQQKQNSENKNYQKKET